MPYNKSDGSRQYNKEERGGWYCTNPKKHEENHEHHSADEPHNHRAERNDSFPNREPKARQQRKPLFEEIFEPKTENPKTSRPSTPKVAIPQFSNDEPKKQKKNGCGCGCFRVVFWFVIAAIVSKACGSIFDETDDEYNNDSEVIYYDEDSDTETADESTLLFEQEDVEATEQEDIIADEAPTSEADDNDSSNVPK